MSPAVLPFGADGQTIHTERVLGTGRQDQNRSLSGELWKAAGPWADLPTTPLKPRKTSEKNLFTGRGYLQIPTYSATL